MSDHSHSDSSSISSTYHSDDGEVMCFISRNNDFLGSGGDEVSAQTGFSTLVLTPEVVTQEDADQILSKMEKPEDGIGFYPTSVAAIIHERHPDISARIAEESADGFVFFYPPGVLANILGIQTLAPVGVKMLCDTCVFSSSRPTLLLTFTQGGDSSKVADYNSQISRSFIDVASKATRTDISVVHGVIDKEHCSAQDLFHKRLTDYKKSVTLMSFPSSLIMTHGRLKVIMKCFIGLHGLQSEDAEIHSEKDDRLSGNMLNAELCTEPLSVAPSHGIPDTEQSHILHTISSGFKQSRRGHNVTGTMTCMISDIQIFPVLMNNYLKERHVDIVSRLRELPGRENPVIVAAGSLLSVINRIERGVSVPNSVIFDACVFSPRQPVLVLTITSDDRKKEEMVEYNSQLARRIVQAVKRNTRYSFGVVRGIVERHLCKTRDQFEEKVLQLQRDAHVMSPPPALVMTESKCLQIIKPILQLLATVETPPQSQPGEIHGHGYSSFDIPAIMKRIEQLELDSQKEKKEMTEKYNHLLEEMEKMKQDYLTDTRLSLLMRPRSSSVSESTVSGYGSTEVDVDIPHKQEAVAAELVTHETEVKDKSQPTQPELTTAAIQSGNMELVQYNRDVTLHQACGEGKLKVVKYILSQGLADINCRGKVGRTPVMQAAFKGQVSVFEFLVSQGCDLSLVDDNNNNVLHYACMGGNVDIVKSLLVSEKCDIESTGDSGMTPIMWAARYGHREVFDLLVKKHCDMKVVSKDKKNILHVACIGGCLDIVQYILSHNIISIDSREGVGRTPVMTAAVNGHKHVFECLVDRKCDVNAADDQMNNILHLACIGGCVDIVQYILSQNIVSIDSRGGVGRTPVMIAAGKGHKHVFEYLVDRKCDVNAVDDEKNNILHLACVGGCVDIVQYIQSNNMVGIDSRGGVGRTPVMIAAGKGHKHVFEYLVDRKCDVNAVDDEKNNILHLACIGGCADIVQYILSHNIVSIDSKGIVGRTPLMAAAENGHKHVFESLVDSKCNVNAVDDQKNNILHLACIGGCVDIVQYILSHNTVSIDSRGFVGKTPVMIAAEEGHKHVFECLVDRKCDVNEVDDEKNNILHLACYGGCVDVVQYILSHNIVSIDSRGVVGRTPLMIAAGNGHKHVFECLVERNCDVIAVDDYKDNILHLACIGGCVDIVHYILSHNIVSIDSRGFVGRTPVMTAAVKGHKHVFECLVERNCAVNAVDDYKDNILHLACYFGQVDIVKHILTRNMVSLENRGLQGMTPVMFAVSGGHIEIVNLLNSKKCNLVALNDNKYNVLHLACEGGHVDMVKYLMTLWDVKGMEKMENKRGETPVHVAERLGHAAVVSVFKGMKC